MGTVMSRLHRGRQMLQTRLQQYAVDQGYIRAEGSTLPGHTSASVKELEVQVSC
jgi:hypothetical protein